MISDEEVPHGKKAAELFSLPSNIVYLSCAGRSPLLKETYEIGTRAMAKKLLPWTISGSILNHYLFF